MASELRETIPTFNQADRRRGRGQPHQLVGADQRQLRPKSGVRPADRRSSP